jgi:hypothetical protein
MRSADEKLSPPDSEAATEEQSLFREHLDRLACRADTRKRLEEMSDGSPNLRVWVERQVPHFM